MEREEKLLPAGMYKQGFSMNEAAHSFKEKLLAAAFLIRFGYFHL